MTPQFIYLPCNARARWDSESEMGYRCETCFAMLGSIGQPKQCQEETKKMKVFEQLGGGKWDYEKGKVIYND